MDKSEDNIKMIILGEIAVGKTNLINALIGEDFQENNDSTISFSFYEGKIKYRKNSSIYNITYDVWDTPEPKISRSSMGKLFIKDSKILLIVYSMSDRKSFQKINVWINFVKENIKNEKYIIALIANKSDLFLNQEVSEEEGENIAKKYNIDFLTTSAKTDAVTFKEFVNRLIINYIKMTEGGESKEDKKDNLKINKGDKNDGQKNKKCC